MSHPATPSELVIRRRVKVDRTRTPQEVLDTTGRNQDTTQKVVDSMPRGEGEEVEVVFFELNYWVTNAELEEEYALRGLKPCDPYSLARVNTDDPAFADEKLNGTHWQDAEGKWCALIFDQTFGRERRVIADESNDDDDWDVDCRFAGLWK